MFIIPLASCIKNKPQSFLFDLCLEKSGKYMKMNLILYILWKQAQSPKSVFNNISINA